MISNGKGFHYLAVSKLSPLLRGISSKTIEHYYCFDCIYSFKIKSKLESDKTICENTKYTSLINTKIHKM